MARIVIGDRAGQLLLGPATIAFIGPATTSIAFASPLGWWLSALVAPWTGHRLSSPTPPR